MNGGDRIAGVLAEHGVRFLFTLCGGHISPILVGCKRQGIKVVDVRDEASAVFAADAVARLTGVPGVAAVTAGPGLTNALTALQNAAMAETPVVLLAGATATVLKGRGALQDIDQLPLVHPIVKRSQSVQRVRELLPALRNALWASRSQVPGPTLLECPVDLLYEEETVRSWYTSQTKGGSGLKARATSAYLNGRLRWMFAPGRQESAGPLEVDPMEPGNTDMRKAARRLARAERPLLLMGSQAVAHPQQAEQVAAAVRTLGIPVYLAGMCRGLLGKSCPIALRHRRRQALKRADLVITAGLPFDFRLGYGRQIGSRTAVISVNRSFDNLCLNRKPTLGVLADPGRFVQKLTDFAPAPGRFTEWLESLRTAEQERDQEIAAQAAVKTDFINPLYLCQRIDEQLDADSLLVADGGDFVATASYIVRPRSPLSWLDPGVFGTLGVGGGFALGAALCRPRSQPWLLWGDGSCAYSLAELDSFVRHRLPVIAVVGNDACWHQIAREQVEVLGDPVGTDLRPTDYHLVAEGYGARGLLVDRREAVDEVLSEARRLAADGTPVLINARIGDVGFRRGSISL